MPHSYAGASLEACSWPSPRHAPHAAHSKSTRGATPECRSSGAGAEVPDNITGRRDVLTALWAGKLKGRSGEELTAYACDQRFVSRRADALVATVAEDLRRAGVFLERKEVQRALIPFHRIALQQTVATD